MCTQEKLQAILSALTETYCNVYGSDLNRIVLYGSYARGDFRKDSDINVAAIVKEPRQQIQDRLKIVWDKAHDLGLEYEILISPTAIPLDEYEKYINASGFYRNIKTDGIIVWEKQDIRIRSIN